MGGSTLIDDLSENAPFNNRLPHERPIRRHPVKPTVGLHVKTAQWSATHANGGTRWAPRKYPHKPANGMNMPTDGWPYRQMSDHTDGLAWQVPPILACSLLTNLYMKITCTPCPKTPLHVYIFFIWEEKS